MRFCTVHWLLSGTITVVPVWYRRIGTAVQEAKAMPFLEWEANRIAERLLWALDYQFPGYARWYALTGKSPAERLTSGEQTECDRLDPVGAEAGLFTYRVNMTMRNRKRALQKEGCVLDLPGDIHAFLARAETGPSGETTPHSASIRNPAP
jgi:hypothetical protein